MSNTDEKRPINKIRPHEFDIDRLEFDRTIIEKKIDLKGKQQSTRQSTRQRTIFPKYDYPDAIQNEDNSKITRKDWLTVLTKPIYLGKGGVPTFNPEYHKTKSETACFWMPLEEEYGGEGAVEFCHMIDKIDKKYGDEIKASPSKYIMIKSGKEEEYIENLEYTPLKKKSPKPKDVSSKDYKPWYRTRIRFPFKEQDNGEPILDIQLAKVDANTKTKTVTTITSLEQLMKEFGYGCTAQFVIEMKTFWILTAEQKGVYPCGFKLTCGMIRILEGPKVYKPKEMNWNDFIDNDEIPDKHTQPVAPNPDESKVQDESEDDALKKPVKKSEESESEDDAPKKPAKKSKESESEDDAPKRSAKKAKESDSEDDAPKKPAKKAKESDSEDDAPKRPAKKAKESDSEDDAPKRPAKKAKESDS